MKASPTLPYPLPHRWNVDTNDWQYADTNPSLMISEFYGKINSLVPAGIIMLQHDLIQGTRTAAVVVATA